MRGFRLIWIIEGQGPTALAEGESGLFKFFLSPIVSLFFFPSCDGSTKA